MKSNYTKKNYKNRNRRFRQKTASNNKYYKGLEFFQKEVTMQFFEMLLMIKLYHWKTHSYATHKATDELYSKFNEHMDKFVEILLGKSGKRIQMQNTKSISLIDINNLGELINRVKNFKNYLVSFNQNKYLSVMSNSDLLNVRDEILGDMNQFLYLLSFK